MRMVSLSTGVNQFSAALKALRLRWHETEHQWGDAVRREFDETVWTVLEEETTGTIQAMDQLDKSLLQAQHECAWE